MTTPVYGAPAENGQASVGGLLLGRGTPYELKGFNPWSRTVRHDQQDRAWAAGAWSGREDTEPVTIPLRVLTRGVSAGDWLTLHWALLAAFRATSADVEFRYRIGGIEYLMRGRPRLVEPEIVQLGTGLTYTTAAFVALDPLTYAAVEHTQLLTLPSTSGGLTAPFIVPFTVPATVTAGSAQVTNTGTADTGLVLRIDAGGAQLVEPRVALRVGATTSVLRCGLTLEAGQWLTLDTAARTAYLNDTVSRRGSVSGPWPLLPPGTAELSFAAGAYSAAAHLTATWRDAWT